MVSRYGLLTVLIIYSADANCHLARFDIFESGRHEDLLLQYPQVVDILLFVAEHFRLVHSDFFSRSPKSSKGVLSFAANKFGPNLIRPTQPRVGHRNF